MKWKQIAVLPVVAVLVVFSSAQVLLAEDFIPSDRLLPPGVSVYVTIPDVGEFKARWKESLFGQLQRDEDLREFRAEFGKLYGQFSDNLREKVGVTLDELLELPGRDLTFAVVHEEGVSPAMLALMHYGDREETVDKLLERAAEAYQDVGAEQSSEEFEDTRIISFKRAAVEEAGRPKRPARTTAYFLKDSYIAVSSDVSALKAVLVRWDGQHSKTFADNEIHKYIAQRCAGDGGKPLLTWYLDPIDFVKSVAAGNPGSSVSMQMFLGFLPTLGLDRLKAIGGAFDMATEQFDTVNRMVAYVEKPTTGVLNTLQFPPINQTPPNWVTAASEGYWSFHWDLETGYLAAEKLIDSIYGAGATAKQIEQMAAAEGGPMLHLKNDVLDQLTGRIQIVEAAPRTDDDEGGRVLIAIEVKDSNKASAVVSAVTSREGFPGKSREFRGQQIYELPASENGDEDAVSFAVTTGHLMIASDVRLLEDVIRGGDGGMPLSETKAYRQVAAYFPAETSIVNFQKQDTQLKAAYELLRENGNTESIGVGSFDFSKLPPFETIEKYLRPTGSYAVPDPNGVLFVTFSLREPVK